MKKCPKCGEVKPLSDFAKDKYRSDGHQVWCKVCNRAACAAAYAKRSQQRKDGTRGRRLRQPMKYVAQSILTHALRSGNIDRPGKCQQCGIACKPEGHHCDYKWPLRVLWLCRVCHIDWHQKNTAFNENGDPSMHVFQSWGKRRVWDWDAIKRDGI